MKNIRKGFTVLTVLVVSLGTVVMASCNTEAGYFNGEWNVVSDSQDLLVLTITGSNVAVASKSDEVIANDGVVKNTLSKKGEYILVVTNADGSVVHTFNGKLNPLQKTALDYVVISTGTGSREKAEVKKATIERDLKKFFLPTSPTSD